MTSLLLGAATNVTAKNPILPDAKEIIWTVIAFAFVLAILSKFAFPAMKKGLQAREERIRADLERADHVRAEGEATLEQYRRQLADARNEANRIIEEARQAADQLRKDMVRRADEEVAELRQRNAAELQMAQERAISQLQSQVRDLALELAEKVVGANLDRQRNLSLVDQYIAELNERSGAGQQGRS
jgi:F-type H+-transporting ATPase subunit b